MDDAMVQLKHPIIVDGVTIDQLTMRAPKVRDMLATSKYKGSAEESEVQLFANLTEVSKDTIAELYLVDYQQLQEAYTGFLSSSQQTPDNPA